MSTRKPLVIISILLLVNIIAYASSPVRDTIIIRDTIFIRDTIIKYIPHKAPHTAILGEYEEETKPFNMQWESQDAIIEKMDWSIDSTQTKYLSRGEGKVKIKNPDGTIGYGTLKIVDVQDYNLFQPHDVDVSSVPTAAYLSLSADSALAASLKQDSLYSALLWENARNLSPPIYFEINGTQYTIENVYKLADKDHPDVVTTALQGTKCPPGHKDDPIPLLIKEERRFGTLKDVMDLFK